MIGTFPVGREPRGINFGIVGHFSGAPALAPFEGLGLRDGVAVAGLRIAASKPASGDLIYDRLDLLGKRADELARGNALKRSKGRFGHLEKGIARPQDGPEPSRTMPALRER